MSNDLISREALMERLIPILNEHGDMYFAGKVIEMLNCIPTAFDKKKVMEELQEAADLSVEDGLWHIELQEAFEIIEEAGIDTIN